MSDPNDSSTPDTAHRADDLVAAIHAALASDASADVRSTGANACRTILRGLEPAPPRNGGPPSSLPLMLAGTPLGAALGALTSIPRDQVLEFIVSGVRAMLGQGSSPTYRPAPLPRAPDTTERVTRSDARGSGGGARTPKGHTG